MSPSLSPRWDLERAQSLARSYRYPASLIEKANQSLGMDFADARLHVSNLFLRLTRDDFVGHVTMDLRWNGRVVADVYGKQDEYALWYVKFYLEDDMTKLCISSCHESERSRIELASGKILLKRDDPDE